MKLFNNKIKQFFESAIWLLIIAATIYVTTQFTWQKAELFLQYILIFGSLASAYFYLSNRQLYRESKNKTAELEKKQKELRNRQKTIDLIFNNSADGIMVLNHEQRIETFSPGMEKITGYSKEEALGRLAQNLLKFRAAKDSSLLPDLMFTNKNLMKDKPYIHNSFISKVGKVVDVEASYTAILDSNSKKPKALTIIRDITYEKALAERDKEFIAVTSHQLNTPLSIIRGYSSLLLKGKSGEINKKQKEYLLEINSSVTKMIELTNNLLSISRIEQQKIKLDIADVNIGELLLKIVGFLSKNAEKKNIMLKYVPSSKDIIIQADQERLQQAFNNLIDNAIKYTKKGTVKVELLDNQFFVVIIIKDSGIGIPKEEIEKIGEKFYRSQNAIDVDNHGSGLGVYIAKTIIEKHQGSISYESHTQRGTTVHISLPKNTSNDNHLIYKES